MSYLLTDLISPRVAKLRTLFIHPSLPSTKFSFIDVKPVGADRMNMYASSASLWRKLKRRSGVQGVSDLV